MPGTLKSNDPADLIFRSQNFFFKIGLLWNAQLRRSKTFHDRGRKPVETKDSSFLSPKGVKLVFILLQYF
jgi:hypothetical protein